MTTRNRELASIIDDSGNITATGNLTVSGTTTAVSSTNTTVTDPLIELNSGASSNSNDLGFVFERGSTGNNAAFIWDESNDTFALGTTTATGSSTGNMSISSAGITLSTINGLTFPTSDGSANQILKTDGSGALSFVNPTVTSIAVENESGNGSTTAFTLSADPGTENNTQVYIDGVYQFKNTYTVSGTTLTFDTAPANGASIEIIAITAGSVNVPTDDSVSTAKIQNNAVTADKIVANAVGVSELNVSDGSNGQALVTNGSGTLSFATISSTLTGIDDQSSSNDDQLTITDSAVIINEDSDDVDFRVESNGNANMFFVDGGNDNILIGTQDQGHIRLNQQLGLAVSGNVYGGMSFVTHSSNSTGNRALLDFNRSRNDTIGSHTVVVNGDSLGTIIFRGDDGDEFLDACYIQAEVDGTPGNGDMPGRLAFFTTDDGASSSTEKMRLTSAGNLHLSGGSDRRIQLGSGGAGANQVSNNTVHIRGDGVDMKLMAASGGQYLFEQNGSEKMRLNGGILTVTSPHASSGGQLLLKSSDASDADDELYGRIKCINNGDTTMASIEFKSEGSSNDEGHIEFNTKDGSALSLRMRIRSNGTVTIPGALSKGSGSFEIQHPLDGKKDTHKLRHSFIEGPQCDNIYRGKVTLSSGTATVDLDSVSGMTNGTFVALNRDIQVFTTNESDWSPVKGSVSGNVLTINCQDNTSTDTVSWMVIGERQDDNIKESQITDNDGYLIVEPEIYENDT